MVFGFGKKKKLEEVKKSELNGSFYRIEIGDSEGSDSPQKNSQQNCEKPESKRALSESVTQNTISSTDSKHSSAAPLQSSTSLDMNYISKSSDTVEPSSAGVLQLVGMGFTVAVSKLALKRNNNRVDDAVLFCLEHSDAEMKQFLAEDALQTKAQISSSNSSASNQSKPSAYNDITIDSASKSTKEEAVRLAAAAVAAKVEAMRRSSSLPVANTNNSPIGSQSGNIESNAFAHPGKCTKEEAVRLAAAAVAAKVEAMRRSSSLPVSCESGSNSKNDSRSPTVTAANSNNNTVFDKLHQSQTKSHLIKDQQEEEDRQRVEAQERRRKLLVTLPVSSSSSSGPSPQHSNNRNGDSVLHNNNSKKTSSTLDNEVFQNLYLKKTMSMLIREQALEEERISVESGATTHRTHTTPSSHGNRTITTTTSTTSAAGGNVVSPKRKPATGSGGSGVSNSSGDSNRKGTTSLTAVAAATTPSKHNKQIVRASPNQVRQGRVNILAASEDSMVEEEDDDDDILCTSSCSSYDEGDGEGDGYDNPHPITAGDIMTRKEATSDHISTTTSATTNTTTRYLTPPRGAAATTSTVTTPTSTSSDNNNLVSTAKSRSAAVPIGSIQVVSSPSSSSSTPKRSTDSSSAAAASTLVLPAGVRRRLLHLQIEVMENKSAAHNESNSSRNSRRWDSKITMKQPSAMESNNSDKDNIDTVLAISGEYQNKEQCVALTNAYCPPIWLSKQSVTSCGICTEPFNTYLTPKHCSNCGQVVCPDCSDVTWPRSMLPPTYHLQRDDSSSDVDDHDYRVCTACNTLLELFVHAMKAGDFNRVVGLYATGNINIHTPYTTIQDAPYAVHCAAISGNVDIMKWLVEEQHCMLYDAAAVIKKGTDANADTTRVSSNTLPLLNGAGHSVLAVTARRGDAPMMRYLTQNRHCSVTDIADVTLLHRALHVALEAQGPLPTLVRAKTSGQQSAL